MLVFPKFLQGELIHETAGDQLVCCPTWSYCATQNLLLGTAVLNPMIPPVSVSCMCVSNLLVASCSFY